MSQNIFNINFFKFLNDENSVQIQIFFCQFSFLSPFNNRLFSINYDLIQVGVFFVLTWTHFRFHLRFPHQLSFTWKQLLIFTVFGQSCKVSFFNWLSVQYSNLIVFLGQIVFFDFDKQFIFFYVFEML